MKFVGKLLLLISGILFFLVGVWGISEAARSLWASVSYVLDKQPSDFIKILVEAGILFGVALILMLCYIFAGIRGIKSFTKGDSRNTTKAFVWAIIILVLLVGSAIYQRNLLPSSIASLVVDVAYIVGAFFLKLTGKKK